MSAGRAPGRPPGSSQTRDLILAAARDSFSERGFDRTGIRHIASVAGVDPALVHHYFGTKQKLFATAMETPIDPTAVLPVLLSGSRSGLGYRVAEWFVGTLDHPDVRDRMLAILRSATSNEAAAAMMREFFESAVLTPLAEALDRPDGRLRATLVQSQLIGLFMSRHVLLIEPIHSTPARTLVQAIAPTLQRYLTGRIE